MFGFALNCHMNVKELKYLPRYLPFILLALRSGKISVYPREISLLPKEIPIAFPVARSVGCEFSCLSLV